MKQEFNGLTLMEQGRVFDGKLLSWGNRYYTNYLPYTPIQKIANILCNDFYLDTPIIDIPLVPIKEERVAYETQDLDVFLTLVSSESSFEYNSLNLGSMRVLTPRIIKVLMEIKRNSDWIMTYDVPVYAVMVNHLNKIHGISFEQLTIMTLHTPLEEVYSSVTNIKLTSKLQGCKIVKEVFSQHGFKGNSKKRDRVQWGIALLLTSTTDIEIISDLHEWYMNDENSGMGSVDELNTKYARLLKY